MKYGVHDHRGGGRSSGRETAARVAGGAIARLLLNKKQITITAFVTAIGPAKLDKHYSELDLSNIDESPVRCPDKQISDEMIELLYTAKQEGDTLGSMVTCVVRNVPAGLGEPVFDKLHADLAKARWKQ